MFFYIRKEINKILSFFSSPQHIYFQINVGVGSREWVSEELEGNEVKTPLCNFCLKSGMLCPKCEEKVRAGEITELDIKIAKLLLGLEEKFPVLQDIYLHRAVETGNIITLLLNRNDVSRILSQGGKILRAIGDETGKKVRILEYKGDLRKFLEDIFAPASIVTINTIWLPDGSTETRVILSERDLKRLPASVETLKELARKIRDVTLRIESETARAR